MEVTDTAELKIPVIRLLKETEFSKLTDTKKMQRMVNRLFSKIQNILSVQKIYVATTKIVPLGILVRRTFTNSVRFTSLVSFE